MDNAIVSTRARILDAALQAFVEDGYERTTTARIRERSGVSNGALFHHFPSKEAIAEALYVDAIARFQAGLWELIGARPRSLRAAVRGVIAHHLDWVSEHSDLARFVYAHGELGWESEGASAVASLNRDLAAAFQDWLGPFAAAGELRPLSMLLAGAIVSGPSHAIARRWLSGQIRRPLRDFVEPLTEAAWAGLRGKPGPRRSGPSVARVGRVTVEVFSEDGDVLARGTLSEQSS